MRVALPFNPQSVTLFVTPGRAMNYLMKRSGRYYFNRKVPKEFKSFDSRQIVRFSLKTDSRKEAIRLMVLHNDKLEEYWKQLIREGQTFSVLNFEKIVQDARLEGFSYLTNAEIAMLPLPEIMQRFLAIQNHIDKEEKIIPVMGGLDRPKLLLSEVLEKFTSYASPRTMNKSANQIRKWINPRKLAMKNFIECVGNKEFSALNRDDILKFRDWWINRVKSTDTVAATANKNLIIIKNIIETVNDNLNDKLDTPHLFRKLVLPIENENRRLPFDSNFIVSTLLNPENLKGLNDQARWVLHAMSETGAGVSELLGLIEEDICLDHKIPHIIIRPRHQKALKTKYRKREIPIVGFALDAFKACPRGFTDYHDRPDSLSGTLSKYLKENKLLPTDSHTVYSLRHSFQDRLLAANAPDRVQADLMGHKFNRQAYGDGATLNQKVEWLMKIQLKYFH